MTELRPVEQYCEEFFYCLENFTRYGGNTMMNKALRVLINIQTEHFYHFKDYALKRRSLDAIKFAFEKCLDNHRDMSDKTKLFL